MDRDDIALSPTSINLFIECERCFWLKERQGRDRPSFPFPSLPGGMDREIKNHFDRFRAKGEVPPELTEADIDAVPYPGGEFLENCRDWRKRPRYRNDGAVLRGAVDDLLNTRGGDIVVMDYKTRGYPPKEDAGVPHYYERQVNLYNLILRSNGYDTADFGLVLYYYPDRVAENGDVVFHTEFREVPVDLGAAKRTFEEAVATLQQGEPDPADDCEFCEWQRAG
ncbi:MAG: PD-(D/E)XK nuclease family protein [Candidatus Nanohaloarchaea archaeon]|nr:PD-(D/E)XK nuclease family protein [Candidatus Nanohaloarchaea archaeon]